MIKKTLCLIFIFSAFIAEAQDFPSEIWHKGMVVMVNEDTIIGKIKYNFDKELIQVESDKKIYTFSGKKVFYFQIFDETVDSYREFYVLPFALINKYETPIFFEVLVEGRLTLLCREKVMDKTVQDPNYVNSYGSAMSYSRRVLVYSYYFLDESGTITKYNLKKKDLLKALAKRADKIDEYMRVNHLRADKRYDLSRIIAFYNGIL